jgi:hypothetical protein
VQLGFVFGTVVIALTSLAMVLSGGMALMIGFLPPELASLIVIVAMVWGATVLAGLGAVLDSCHRTRST